MPSTIYWQGTQQDLPQIDTGTVGSSTAGQVFTATLTVGSGPTVTRVVSYTAVTGDTTSTIAAAVAAAWAASSSPEVREITAAVDPNATTVVRFTGPDNGAPFTLATAASGGGTFTHAVAQNPQSASDASDVKNYVGGALPSNGDTLIFDRGGRGPQFNLTAITAVTLAELRRYPPFTGQWGNPDQNPNGYREYRPTHLETAAAVITLIHADGDRAQQFRVKSTAAGTPSVSASGSSPPVTDLPVFEVYNLTATATVYAGGASIGVGMQPATDAAGTLQATNSRVWTGPRETFTTPGTIVLTDCVAFIASGWTTATFAGDSSDVTATQGAAASTATKLLGGRLTWRSSASPGSVIAGPNSFYDLTLAPAVVPAHSIEVHDGATIDNRAARLAATSTLTYKCPTANAVYLGPVNEVHTLS